MMRHRWLIALAALATALVLVASDANARAGGGFSGGSRGFRTFSKPPSTRTAPNTAAPIQRSVTQPNAATGFNQASRPGGFFGGGLLGGLAAGFLGAGLFGLLFGHGLFGGMGGLVGVIAAEGIVELKKRMDTLDTLGGNVIRFFIVVIARIASPPGLFSTMTG